MTDLRIEVPSAHPTIAEPLIIETYHHAEGKYPPATELNWAIWNGDPLLTEFDPEEHLEGIVEFLRRFISEETAAYRAMLGDRLTSAGTEAVDREPFPPSESDRILVRSWKGSFDRELIGHWPGWPKEPGDPFYKDLKPPVEATCDPYSSGPSTDGSRSR
ncbi:MAG: hypothetical protein U0S12_12975 [Fimbriimonadales bacterium]